MQISFTNQFIGVCTLGSFFYFGDIVSYRERIVKEVAQFKYGLYDLLEDDNHSFNYRLTIAYYYVKKETDKLEDMAIYAKLVLADYHTNYVAIEFADVTNEEEFQNCIEKLYNQFKNKMRESIIEEFDKQPEDVQNKSFRSMIG